MKKTYCLEVSGDFAFFTRPTLKIGCNAPAACGSGKRYKKLFGKIIKWQAQILSLRV